METQSLRPRAPWRAALLALLLAAGAVSLYARPDLDVVYISRSPLYWRYNVQFEHGLDPLDPWNGKPYQTPEEQMRQRWPAAGEIVTFTAVIKNSGDVQTGGFPYSWYMDGAEVASGMLPSVLPGGKISTSYQWRWDSVWNNHTIRFVADPDDLIREDVKSNNSRTDYTNALSFRLHVWQMPYDWFRVHGPLLDRELPTFEDWAQRQIGYLNEIIAKAVHPLTPNGVPEHVRLDEVVVEDDTTPDPEPRGAHAPPDWNWDGRWGFGAAEYPQIWAENPQFITGPYSWVLHEWGHQLGLIDLYNMNIGADTNLVRPDIGHRVSSDPCLMVTTGRLCYGYHTAYALLADLHKRRGYFGEYMYDLPAECYVRVMDAYGKPLPGATVSFYREHGHQFTAPANYALVSDADGYIRLPDDTVYGETTTGNGHVLRDNPWGLIHLSGFNNEFFCQINWGGQTDYQYVEVLPFNVAYWSGHTDRFAYNMATTIVPGGRPTTRDLNAICAVSADEGYAVGNAGTVLRWDGTTWTSQSSPTTEDLSAIAGGPSYAYAVGKAGTVLKYDGSGWRKLPSPLAAAQFTAVAAPDSNTVLAGADRGQLYRSTDGGASWTRLYVTQSPIYGIDFHGPTRGMMVCYDAPTYYTVDGGASWGPSVGTYSGPMYSCAMASESEAWTCTVGGDVFRSLDGGETWRTMADLGLAAGWGCMDMTEGGYGWAGGGFDSYRGIVLLVRYAGGSRRHEASSPQMASDTINAIACVDAARGWLVGKAGMVMALGRVKGDVDCDGFVDFDDINPFVLALTGRAAYEQGHPGCEWANGDIDGDGDVNFDDIGPFVACLVHNGCR